jgi:hypothetical protein
MSHLIEEYAKNLGVKIAKPIVSKHFWPLAFDKFITICLEPNLPSKQYNYYSTVLEMIMPYLEKENIKIIQIGPQNSPRLTGVHGQILGLNFKQYAYIISKSKLHIGIDNVYSHYASSIDVPLVTLFGNVFSSVSRGYWSKNQINIEAPWKVKPSLNAVDANSSINKIKPEQIADAIFKQLKANAKINIKTEHIGSHYHKKVVEIVPNFFSPISQLQQEHVFIRADYGFDQDSFVAWCRFLNSFSVFSNKIIPMDVVRQLTGKAKGISYLVDGSIDIPEAHLHEIKNCNIQPTILVLDKEKLSEYRNKYFDFDVHPYGMGSRKDLPDDFNFNDLFFSSSKTIFSNGQTYPTTFHMKRNLVLDAAPNLEDNDEILEEINHFYVYRKINP